MSAAVDLKTTYKAYYSPKPGQPELVTMPKMRFLMVDGAGQPGNADFQNAVGALYSTAYTLKFGRKKAGKGPDFKVGSLEGLWWNSQGPEFEPGKPENWLWTLMIWLPDFITDDEFQATVEELKVKKPNPALDKIRLEELEEAESVQIMHLGPYSEEAADIALMRDYATVHGYQPAGKHHEIYFGDPRRAKPEKLKTILRWPVKPAA